MKIVMPFLCLFLTICYSQPKWIYDTPSGYSNDYYVASGSSNKSESDARQIAFTNVIQKVIQNGNITINASQTIANNFLEKFRNGESLSLDVISQIQNEMKISGESQTIRGLKEEESYTQYESGLYIVWLLVKTPKRYPLPYTEPSKFWLVIRSLGPSVEQFHKGETTKGFLIAGGTATFVVSGIVFSNLKVTAESDARNSRTQVLRDYYNDNANTYNNISLACFVATAALYIYNIVDALATDGKKVYVLETQSKKNEIYLSQNLFPKPQPLFSLKIEL